MMLSTPVEMNIGGAAKPKDADAVRKFNTAVIRLADRRQTQIAVDDDHLLGSRLAWMIATYQQAVLYRIVMLASGCAASWNAGNFLCAHLAARAVIETVALLTEFENQLAALIDTADLATIDTLLMNRLFASRDKELLSEHPEIEAINALTFINKLDKRLLPGLRDHYDALSEFCHPNAMGHRQMFGKLDPKSGTTEFSETHNTERHLSHILAALTMVRFAETSIASLDSAIPKIAKMQQTAPDPTNWNAMPKRLKPDT